jgi:hypothetical protein
MSVGWMVGTVGGESSHMCRGFESGWLQSLVGAALAADPSLVWL